jgi:hypothetical protein
MLNRTILWVLLVVSVAAGYTARMGGGQSSDLSAIFKKLDVMIPCATGCGRTRRLTCPTIARSRCRSFSSKVADLFLRSAAFRCDGRKDSRT